ncbi:hypothetical protein RB595_002979 [Gaeumannomyces hyphopodioides]
MPAPGQQHSHVQNPFEDARPRLSLWTAQEIAALQTRLDRQLGPEYLSARSGPSGQKVHYVAADKIITLANEVFGFNGWSTSIQDVQVDFADVHPQTGKISLGLSVVVRVTLRDGTFHEDMGYGHIENCKSKASAFEKAKKEGTTDALKRALRHFGNLLGNCIYDKDYLAKVTKIKVAPTKFDEGGLHRHSDFVKKEIDVEKPKLEVSAAPPAPVAAHPDSFDDFLGELDEADFCVMEAEVEGDSHSEDVTVPDASHSTSNSSSNDRGGNNGNRPPQGGHTNNNTGQQRQMPPPPRQHPPPQRQSAGPASINNQSRQPQTPGQPPSRPGIAPNGGSSNQMNNHGIRPQPQANNQGRPQPQQPGNGMGQRPANNGNNGMPQHTPPAPQNGAAGGESAGFFSARAVPRVPDDGTAIPPGSISGKAFDPKAESPSIRKTPGIDHNSSRPLTKNGQHVAPPSSSQAANDKSSLGAGGGMRDSISRPQGQLPPSNHQSPQGPMGRPNVLNPQLDHSRRIGAPGGPGSPLANRNQYRPPTIKRPPLTEVPNGAGGGSGGEVKRVKLQ